MTPEEMFPDMSPPDAQATVKDLKERIAAQMSGLQELKRRGGHRDNGYKRFEEFCLEVLKMENWELRAFLVSE